MLRAWHSWNHRHCIRSVSSQTHFPVEFDGGGLNRIEMRCIGVLGMQCSYFCSYSASHLSSYRALFSFSWPSPRPSSWKGILIIAKTRNEVHVLLEYSSSQGGYTGNVSIILLLFLLFFIYLSLFVFSAPLCFKWQWACNTVSLFLSSFGKPSWTSLVNRKAGLLGLAACQTFANGYDTEVTTLSFQM